MKLSKMIALLAAGLLLALTPGCGGSSEDSSALRIGVTVYRGDDTYLANMTASLQKSAEDYFKERGGRVYVTVSDAQENQSIQNGQIDRFLSLGYDVLCVNLVDRTNAGGVVEKARAAGVPVVFFNREPVREDLLTWDKAYYVGSDARESARLQAQIVLDAWRRDSASLDTNGDGVLQYVMLEGESRHQDAIIRTEVSVKTLKDGGVPLERVDGGIADWNRSQAAALTEGYFKSRGSGIELILANNDDMALGAADAVERLGLKFSAIVGIDGIPQGMEAVGDGRLMGTVVMDYTAHGKTLFKVARALADGENPSAVTEIGDDRSVRIPMSIYTRPS